MIIDSHQHVMFPTEKQVNIMDKAGIDKVILFSTTPHVERAATLEEMYGEMQLLYRILSGNYPLRDRLENMKRIVDELSEAISKVPERFYGFGPLPLGISEQDTAEWFECYVLKNSFKGVGEFAPGSLEQMQQLEIVFQVLSDYSNFPLWVHTFHPVTLEAMRLLMKLCDRYPEVPVIFGHMGGLNWMDAIGFVEERKNVYLDLSAAFTTLSVRTALTEVPEKCLFSSDAPFGEPQLSRQAIEFLSPSAEIKDMALGGNIGRLLEL